MSETTFKRETEASEWYWHTQAANGDIVADGGQGYGSLDAALNGFMSQQGYSSWERGQPLPEGYVMTPITPNEYTIEKLES